MAVKGFVRGQIRLPLIWSKLSIRPTWTLFYIWKCHSVFKLVDNDLTQCLLLNLTATFCSQMSKTGPSDTLSSAVACQWSEVPQSPQVYTSVQPQWGFFSTLMKSRCCGHHYSLIQAVMQPHPFTNSFPRTSVPVLTHPSRWAHNLSLLSFLLFSIFPLSQLLPPKPLIPGKTLHHPTAN